ncbi:MAG TPA: hypothetical protein PK147_04240 [Saprospiraceae bacterium]|nr:hypothetical protein [Saprospiraceae bacterium]HPQ21034.1 hypothetical protein [Saprospiraceae bacterium]
MRTYLGIILCVFCAASCFGQWNRSLDSITCTLEELKSPKDYQLYYKRLVSFTKAAHLKVKNSEITIGDFKEILPLYEHFPGNQKDSSVYRKSLGFLAQFARKLDYYSISKQYYEIAQKFCFDNVTDSLMWYNELQLAFIYSRLNDYERANYYLKLCEKNNSINSNPNRLSRLYAEIGRNHMWLGDTGNMIKYYNQGLNLGMNIGELRGINAIYNAYIEYFLDWCADEDRLDKALYYLKLNEKFLNENKNIGDYERRLSDNYKTSLILTIVNRALI